MRLANPPWLDDECVVLGPATTTLDLGGTTPEDRIERLGLWLLDSLGRCRTCGGDGRHQDYDACLTAFCAWVNRVTEGER